MNHLSELIEVVSFNKLDKITLLGRMDKDLKVYKLYHAIRNNRFKNEDELKRYLYGDSASAGKNFKRLKDRLANILISTILLSATENKTDYRSVYMECYKNFSAIKILMVEGAKASSIDLAVSTLKKARKYALTNICYELSKELLRHFALNGLKKEKERFERICRQYHQLMTEEYNIEILFSNLTLLLANKKKLTAKEFERAEQYMNQILESYPMGSFASMKVYYNTHLTAASLNNDTARILSIGAQVKEYFSALPFTPSDKTFLFFMHPLIPAYIADGNHLEAGKIIKAGVKTWKPGRRNWHTALYFKVLNALYAKDYKAAVSAMEKAKKRMLNGLFTEKWNIMSAYLFYLSLSGKVKFHHPFRLSKFLNEVPVFSKDKIGANTSIIIAQLLILLVAGRRGEIIDKTDTLKQYNHNYLKTPQGKRAGCFIRILRELALSRFDKEAFRKRTVKYLEVLESTPRTIADLETEIIPFEDCYELVLHQISPFYSHV